MAGGTFEPMVQSWSYNSRLQGTGMAVTKGGAALWSMTNSFDATANNGNISGQTVAASGAGGVNVTSTLAYDALNRLTGVAEGGLSQSFGYDSVGNRWLSGGMNLSPFTPTTSAWFDAGTNRISSGVIYDDAAITGPGNMTGLGNVTLEYGAENFNNNTITNTSSGSSHTFGIAVGPGNLPSPTSTSITDNSVTSGVVISAISRPSLTPGGLCRACIPITPAA